MPELAEVFRTFGPAYLERFGERMPQSHRRALVDLVLCRTEVMGGHLAKIVIESKKVEPATVTLAEKHLESLT